MRKHDTKDAEKISALAYEMWEKAGRPDTDPDKFWYEAEQELAITRFGAYMAVNMVPEISRDSVPRNGVTLFFGHGLAAVTGRRLSPGPWG